jgi:type IV pilus assembly protein PilA
MNTQSKKGFTLVEIMIVVVIIGLLAAMAIPAFQKVRTNAVGKTVINDARQIGSGAQQFFLENAASTVTVGITPATGAVTGPLSDYVSNVSKGLTLSGSPITTAAAESGAAGVAFIISHALGTITFNNEGDIITDNAFGN